MAYKNNPGRGPMMKTGRGIPSALLQVTDKKEKTDPITKGSKKEYKIGSKIQGYKVVDNDPETGDLFTRKGNTPDIYRLSKRDAGMLSNTKSTGYQANFKKIKHGYNEGGRIYEEKSNK
jgi:hypothetical protein